MAKIDRFNGNLIAFASGALSTERTVFGRSTKSDDLTDNINDNFVRGWAVGVNPDGYPPEQYFNAVSFVNGQLAAYLHQMGVAEYSPAQVYYKDSYCNYKGSLYVSLTDDNSGNTPSESPTNWVNTDARSAMPVGYLKGFDLAGSGSSNNLSITLGACSSRINRLPIISGSGFTKKTNEAFAAGTGNGATLFDTTSFTGWAYVFVLCSTTDPDALDFCINNTSTLSALPSGFDDYRRIGCIGYDTGINDDFSQINGYYQSSINIPNPQVVSNIGTASEISLKVSPDVPLNINISLNVCAKLTLSYTSATTTTAPYAPMAAQFNILSRSQAIPAGVLLSAINQDLYASFPLFKSVDVKQGEAVYSTCCKMLAPDTYSGSTTSYYELHFEGYTENIGTASPANLCTVTIDSYISGWQDSFSDFSTTF